METIFDVIIIGAGPAGLSAGLYAARAKMTTLILEKDRTGGQITGTEEVANYPGSIKDATGPTLVARMVEQSEEFGATRLKAEVTQLDLEGTIKRVHTDKGIYQAKSIIMAMGAHPRLLDVQGEKALTGKGVSYCATCDAEFFSDLEVYVFGGGDTALEEAMFITKFARKVTIVHRRDVFRAAKSIVEKAQNNPKIEFVFNSGAKRIIGDGMVQGLELENFETGECTEILADPNDGLMGIFVFVGYIPETQIVKDLVNLDKSGYIITDELMQTGIPGVYAAGDIRVKSLRQVVTATADGAIAAVQAEKYVDSLTIWRHGMLVLDKENFEMEVLKASGLVVVDFWGEGCEPCKVLMPEFEALSETYDEKVTFAKLNTSQERRLAISQRVLGLPTVVLYKDGERIAECTKDSATQVGIKQMIDGHL